MPISAQNLVEFQAVATRPVEANGLGLNTTEACAKAREIEALFSFLPDNADIYPHWRKLIQQHDVKGKQVHDARIVAVMLANDINRLITFNASHFIRFSEITVFNPQDMR